MDDTPYPGLFRHPFSASVSLERLTVSAIAWSLVCCGQSISSPRFWNGEGSRPDYSGSTPSHLPSCHKFTVRIAFWNPSDYLKLIPLRCLWLLRFHAFSILRSAKTKSWSFPILLDEATSKATRMKFSKPCSITEIESVVIIKPNHG